MTTDVRSKGSPGWGRWFKQADERIIHCVVALGFTEADVRDWRRAWAYDIVQIRMWNWRKVEVTGYMYATAAIPPSARNIHYHGGLSSRVLEAASANAAWWVTWEP